VDHCLCWIFAGLEMGRSCVGNWVNPGTAPTAMGAWTQKLALRRVVALRKTGCGNHEPDSVGTHERA